MSLHAHGAQSPQVLLMPLRADSSEFTLLIVHEGKAWSAPDRLNELIGFYADGRGGWIAAAQVQTGKWGYLNSRGEWLIAPTLDSARGFSDDGYSRFCEAGRWGYANLAAQVVIAPQYEDACAMRNGVAGVRTGKNEWRIVDASGQFTCEEKFLNIFSFAANGLACALGRDKTRQKRFGFVDRTGAWRIEPRFHRPARFGEHNVAAATDDDKLFGVIDTRGEWVLKPKYARVNDFNDDGFAYYYLENSWSDSDPPGYLNLQGQSVVQGDRHLSQSMVCGIAMNSSDGHKYVRSDNTRLPVPFLSYGTEFRTAGRLAVALLSSSADEAVAEPERTRWGVLHDDGTFVRAPAELLEPLTDGENWMAYSTAESETPLVPFLACSRTQLAWMDREGVIHARASYADGRVSLTDAAGQTLWQSAASDGECVAPKPYFASSETDFLENMSSLDDVVPLAEKMLAQAEEQLHQLASEGETTVDEEQEGEDETDDDDEEEDDDLDFDGLEDGEALRATTVKCRVMRAYLDEQHFGHYEFLNDDYIALNDKVLRALIERLSAKFGASDPDPEHATGHVYSNDGIVAWPVLMKQPLEGDDGVLRESRELWLSLYTVVDFGDGDVWHEVWLRVAPSVSAFRLALNEEDVEASGENLESAEQEHEDEGASPEMPTTRDGWLAAVREDASNLRGVPHQWFDDEMLDCALAEDVELFECAPAAFQTRERLESLIRRGAAEASSIPPQCMTAEGLALARSLHEGDLDWDYRDQGKSVLPDAWDQNAFGDVWGALLDEQKVIKALNAGAPLCDVPHWLKNAKVEQAALKADIYNVQYIDKASITTELAARAVRHDYGQLIEYLPEHLLTAELCRVSASVNGLSLAHMPLHMRTVDVCVAGLRDRQDVFMLVPDALRIGVASRLIEEDLAQARKDGEDRTGSHWHGHRAWANLWADQYEDALADAHLAVKHVRYPQHAHYVLASAYRALGCDAQAKLEASTVLSIYPSYSAEWDEDEDTSWLKRLKRSAPTADPGGVDGAAALERLRSHPLSLSDVPRATMTSAMVEAAVQADAKAIQFVPRRLMTPELYALAFKEGEKLFTQIPQAMMSEAACIELVRDTGRKLEQVPSEWRTRAVCVAAVLDSPSAMEHVPQELHEAVRADVDSLRAPHSGGEGESGGKSRSALSEQFIESLMREHRGETIGVRDKAVRGAWAVGALLTGKSDEAATLKGFSGWLQQRPGLMLMLNGVISLVALILHLIVTVVAWRAEGVWIGLATGVLMGFSEVYWAWRHFFVEPQNIWLGVCCLIVLLYFVWKFFYKRVIKEIARVDAAQRGGET